MAGRPNLFDAHLNNLTQIGDFIVLPTVCGKQASCSIYHYNRNRKRNTRGFNISIKTLVDGRMIAEAVSLQDPTIIPNSDFLEVYDAEFIGHEKSKIKDGYCGSISFSITPDIIFTFDVFLDNDSFVFENGEMLNEYGQVLDRHLVIDDDLNKKIIQKLKEKKPV